jgi:gamma-glutamylcyclotransferase (GGCT)/AIG2-like uncharacterized protein YtfP
MIATPEGTFPLFIYGTLRPGQTLWPWLRDSVHEGKAWQAWVIGFRLAESDAGNYPVMIKVQKPFRPEDKFVRGTLVFVKNTPDFQSIWNMELRAGYEAETVHVHTGTGPGKLTFVANAFAFVWPTLPGYDHGNILTPRFLKGGQIEYDWAEHVAQAKRFVPGPEEIETIPSQRLDSDT